jgi:hypothetical protein
MSFLKRLNKVKEVKEVKGLEAVSPLVAAWPFRAGCGKIGA